MRKFKITLILVAIIIVFTSCITQKDIISLQKDYEELENEYELTKGEKSELENDIQIIKTQIEEIENENLAINDEIEKKTSVNAALKEEIPVPMFCFDAYQFNAILGDVQNETKIGEIYYDGWINPAVAKTKNGIKEEIIQLQGDINTDAYLCIIYYSYSENLVVKSITFEYSSDEYKDEYDDLIASVGPAMLMTFESPPYYKDEYFERGKEIIEKGSYLDGLVKLIREETENGESLSIFIEN